MLLQNYCIFRSWKITTSFSFNPLRSQFLTNVNIVAAAASTVAAASGKGSTGSKCTFWILFHVILHYRVIYVIQTSPPKKTTKKSIIEARRAEIANWLNFLDSKRFDLNSGFSFLKWGKIGKLWKVSSDFWASKDPKHPVEMKWKQRELQSARAFA